MTHGERITLLEAQVAELQAFRNVFVNPLNGQLVVSSGLSTDGLVPYLQFNARIGICTNFWMLKPLGHGATFSVGTAIDRYAGYFEVDEVTCPDAPSVAVYGAVCSVNTFGQPNHAFEGVAANSPDSRGLVLSLGDKVLAIRAEGIQLIGNWLSFYIGKTLADARKLWPL